MMWAELRVACLFVVLMTIQNVQAQVCNGPTTAAGAKMPPVSTTYQANVEVNILRQNYSVAINEYQDYNGSKAAMTVFKAGNKETLVFSYATNEVFHIVDNNCQVQTTDNFTYSFLYAPFASRNSGSDKRTNFGIASAFNSAVNNSVYNGTIFVRGIPADRWTRCFQWNSAFVQANFYFSQKTWGATPQVQVPLRLELIGNNSVYTYEIIDYVPAVIADPSIFVTPSEVVCPNRKPTKSLPKFGTYFKYKAEIVDSNDSMITHYAIWYDEDQKLLREDTRQLPTQSGMITEYTSDIHDFNTGVRYVIDHGNGCTVKSIAADDTSTERDVSKYQFNGTLVLGIQDPNQFLYLNSNYIYIGQRMIRGITCDVFSAIIPDFPVQDKKYNATFEYAFLAGNWSDLLLNGNETNVQNYPVQLIITVPQIDYTQIYNIFEFAEDHAPYPTYDVSSCFDDEHKIGFRVTFPGSLKRASLDQWTAKVYTELVQTMKVYPLRVGGLAITSDDDNIYVNAFLLPASATAQFQKGNLSLEFNDDSYTKGISMLDECATFCVDSSSFTCMSFQYCPDDGGACRISTNMKPTHSILMPNATVCENYIRTVKVVSKREPLVTEAFNSLQTDAFLGNLQVVITNNDGSPPTTFTAINVDLLSGKMTTNQPLPTLPTAFFYRVETVVSLANSVEETYAWYDKEMGLVRYDNRDISSDTPVFMSHIHDFNLGVAYQINRVTGQCVTSPIASSELFDVTAGTTTRNGGLVLSMKSPNGLFFLDDTYSYVGKGTARGILCDVFESRRNDFDLEYYNMSDTDTVFRYFFQSSDWEYIAPQATSVVSNQPIQLYIEDTSTGNFLTYNFYDFTEQHFASSFYDASSCYSKDEKKTFLIIFKDQPYHPILDDSSNTFTNAAIMELAQFFFVSPINFQGVSLSYDETSVYLVVTVLGHTSQLSQFTPVMKVAYNASVSSSIYSAVAEDCASSCLQTSSFICNSFDFCQDIPGPNCLLGTLHGESEGDPISSTGPCTHYSRTENGTYPGMNIQKMYATITDYVYDNLFHIIVALPNGTDVSYTATDIRDDLYLPTDPSSAAGSVLQKFVITPGYKLNDSVVDETQNALSITDCALLCLQENTFDCQTFDYQFSVGTCRLSHLHPDQYNVNTVNVTRSRFSSVYSRMYTEEYTKFPGKVFSDHPDKLISSIASQELCAKACNTNPDFTCESFEFCYDNTCRLRRNHIFEAHASDLQENAYCDHYSRDHLYDYISRANKDIQGHDNISVVVNNASQCAWYCAAGELLPQCASFEICSPQRGELMCTLSLADPTIQTGLIIENNYQCSLYTKANPTTPAATTTARSNPVTTNRPPVSSRQSSRTRKTTPSGGTRPSGATRPSGRTRKTTPSGNSCQGQAGSIPSHTGARVGLGFGMLFLGILLGAVVVYFIIRKRGGLVRKQEDAHSLSTYTDTDS